MRIMLLVLLKRSVIISLQTVNVIGVVACYWYCYKNRVTCIVTRSAIMSLQRINIIGAFGANKVAEPCFLNRN